MPQYTLHQIEQITRGKLYGDKNCKINTLETDSRKAVSSPDSLFIAIKGDRHDGHRFINELYQNGIRSFIVEKQPDIVKSRFDINFIVVDNSIMALQQLAANYRSQLKMPIIGITGSNGKTVIKEWLFQCLSAGSLVSRSPRSYNSQTGVPLSVWMLKPDSDWGIIEAGISMPGEMVKLEKIISPDFGIFSNIGQAHQENFNNLEEKIREKLLLFQYSKVIYYCRDHELVHKEIAGSKLSKPDLISWSSKYDDSFLFVATRKLLNNSTEIEIIVDKVKRRLLIPFNDDASVENCLHIITFLFHQGFTEEYIRKCIAHITPVAMRLEQIKGAGNCTLINDSYNSDINSLKIALDFLSLQKQHKSHTVILSDLQQSGLNPKELYKEIIGLIRLYHIHNFFAIGPEITAYPDLPTGAIKYGHTREFLQHIHEHSFNNQAILIKGAREFRFEDIVRALSEKKHSTILEINLNNLIYNLNYFRSLLKPQTRIMVMVKALSYGSGSYEISNLLQHEKVDYLGVAFADEGIVLRNSGIILPIMVMSPSPDAFNEIIEYNLEPEIYSFNVLKEFSAVISSSQIDEYPIHLKLDTGMHRLGFMPSDIPQLLDALDKFKNIKIKTVFSHLAVSDNKNEDEFTLMQIQRFEEMYNAIVYRIGYKPHRHILNSAGIERFPEAHFEMVRLGIGLHGISGNDARLKPVSRLKAYISQIKHIELTETVGYNRRGKLERDSSIAIIPIGYADGLDRKFGNHNGKVFINGQTADFIGDICMDMSMIDITGLKAEEGDEVIIFGEENPIQQLSRQIGTIPYEILTNISARVKRVYINE